MYDVIVVGGGFRGLLVSYLASRRNMKVALIESSAALGGFLNSFKWEDFIVDRGVQLFDSVPLELEEIIVDGLGIEVSPIDFTYGSVYDGHVTPGFALPNYNSISRKEKEKMRTNRKKGVSRGVCCVSRVSRVSRVHVQSGVLSGRASCAS